MNVDIGDVVKQGQTLAVLISPELNADFKQKDALVAQAQSLVAQAMAAVDVAQASVATAKAKVAAAEAGIAKADADVERWKSESARVNELAANKAVTSKLADEVLNQRRAAEAARAAAAAELTAVKASVAESEARLRAAQADVQAARSRLEVAQADRSRASVMLEYTQIKAPFAGVVTHRYIHTGHYVQPVTPGRDQPLFNMAHSETVRVVVYVHETDAGFTGKGDPAVVRVPALDNRQYKTVITRTASSLDPETRTLRAEIELENSTGELQQGMYCNVSIVVEKRPDVLVIPTSAVFDVQGQPTCAAIVDGRIRRLPLALGLRADKEVEVTTGLRGGELIVPRNPANYPDGQPVEVRPQ